MSETAIVSFWTLPVSFPPLPTTHPTPERSPFHPKWGVNAALPTGPSASRITFSVTTITDGNARIGGHSTFPALTLAWLYTEPSPCGGVRPARDQVDSDPGAVFEDPNPGSSAGRPLEPRVCHHTQEPTVLSMVSCRPFHLNINRFHQPCLSPGRTSRIGEDCRFPVPRGGHLSFLAGQPGVSWNLHVGLVSACRCPSGE